MVWNARSQAAYHGYSHLSGMEITSAFSMWNHSVFRTPCAGGLEQRMALVLAQPVLQIEVVVLLAPQHSRQRLAMHPALIFGQRVGRDPLVEFVGIGDPALEYLLEIRRRGLLPWRPSDAAGQSCCPRRARRGHSGPRPWSLSWQDSPPPLSRDDVGVEPILDVGRSVGLAPKTLGVALIFGEEQLRGTIAMEPVLAQLMVRGLNGARPRFAQRRLAIVLTP